MHLFFSASLWLSRFFVSHTHTHSHPCLYRSRQFNLGRCFRKLPNNSTPPAATLSDPSPNARASSPPDSLEALLDPPPALSFEPRKGAGSTVNGTGDPFSSFGSGSGSFFSAVRSLGQGGLLA